MRRLVAPVLFLLLCGPAAAAGWHHPLYLGNDGYWRQRVRVDIQSAMDREVAGAPVSVPIGPAAGEADLAGAAAEAVRVVNTDGLELLYAIYGPTGDMITRGPIPEGAALVLPVECPALSSTECYVYFDNPAAWAVPDFYDASFTVRNGGVESGSGDTPTGWVHDSGDAQHQAAWSTESPHSGSRCLKTTVAAGADPTWISTRQSGIYIIGGAGYLLRGWVKAENVAGFAGWYLHVGNDSNPMLLNQNASAGGGTYDWQQVSAEFTAPADADRADLGTMLWGSGVAWFDDITLECTSEPALVATAAPKETLSIAETGAAAPWYDDDPGDDLHWDFRFPIKLTNLSDEAISGAAQADITIIVSRLGSRLNWDSLRVTYDSALVAHYRIGDAILFPASAPPHTARTYYLYASTDPRIPPAAGSDYAGLLVSAGNLVQNPSFEQGDPLPDAWQLGAPPEVTMGLDQPGLFGARAAIIQTPSDMTPSWLGWRQDITVQPGRTYLYSAWLKCQNLQHGSVQIYAHYRNAAGDLCATRQYAGAGAPISGATDWTLMSGVFQMPSDCVTFQLHLTMLATGTLWHDGVVLAEVTPATLGPLETRTGAVPSGLQVWPVNAVVKVFQDDPPPAQPQPARITAARNEQEPLQLALRSSTAIAEVRVELDPPAHAGGARLNDFEIAVVGYVPVDHKTSYFNSTAPRWHRKYPTEPGACDGWAGWWPDPLLPRDAFPLPAETTQPVWITVRVPRDAPAGDYAGKVRLVSGAAVLAEVPFTVHVWDFALPADRHVAAIYDVRRGFQWPQPGQAWEQSSADIRALMADRRLCADTIVPDPIITYQNGQVQADFTAFDQAAEHYFDVLKMPRTYTPWYFYCFGWGHPPGDKFGEKPYPGDYPYEGVDRSQLRPEYKAAYQACLRAYWEHMKEKGWADKVVLYISDEPYYSLPHIVDQMKALCDMVHEVDPALPIYSSTWQHVPAWNGYLDVWGIGHYGTVSPETMQQILAAGDRIYFTTDGQMCTDTPYAAIERLLPHYCFQYGAEAYEFWGISWLTYDPYQFGWHSYIQQSDQPGSTTWVRYPNGDGFLAYPGGPIGHDGPVTSIRMEQAREGVEDYEYLYLLREAVEKARAAGLDTTAGDAALAAAAALVSTPNPGGRYSSVILPDPDAVFAVKETLAQAIEGSFRFRDVGLDHWAFHEIVACWQAGIVGGYPDNTYRPQLPVTRDQTAVYVSRALAGGDAHVPTGPAEATFADVPVDHWAFRYIEYAAANGVVEGFPEGDYRPALVVDRAQMAVFVARAIATPPGEAGLAEYEPPPDPTFPDVALDFWARKHVEYIADPARAIARGYPDGRYHPEYVCTRDQMAVYVARAFRLLT